MRILKKVFIRKNTAAENITYLVSARMELHCNWEKKQKIMVNV